MITIPVKLAVENVTIPMTVATEDIEIPVSISVTYEAVSGDTYEGSYQVTPTLNDQTLETEGKVMRDDLTVYAIPISRVSNPYDGITVLIG